MSFLLDTNCLIDVGEARLAAFHVQQILAAAADGRSDVAMVASSPDSEAAVPVRHHVSFRDAASNQASFSAGSTSNGWGAGTVGPSGFGGC